MSGEAAIRAGRAFVEIFADDTKMQRKLRQVSASFKSWGSTINSVGRKMLGAGLAASSFFGFTAKSFADVGSELQHMHERTGASVEQLSVLKFAAGQTGTEFEALEGGIKKLQKNLVEAKLGSHEAAEMFNELGIDGKKLADADFWTILGASADKIAALKNPNEQAAIAMKTMGRNGTALLPILKQGSAGLARWKKEAEEFGLIMSTEDAAKATKLQQALDLLWSSVRMGAVRIGAALAPELTELARWLAHVAKQVGDFIQANSGWFVSASKMATGLVIAGAALIGLGSGLKLVSPLITAGAFGLRTFGLVAGRSIQIAGYGIKFLSMGVGRLGSIIGRFIAGLAVSAFKLFTGGIVSAATSFLSLMTPIGIIGFALVGLAAYFLYASGVIGKAIEEGSKFFKQLKADGIEAFGGIKAALSHGDIAAAAKLLWALLKLEWAQGSAALNAVWQEGKRFFLDTWTNAVFNLSGVFLNAWASLQSAWVQTVDFMLDAWDGLVRGMLSLMQPVVSGIAGQLMYVAAKIKGLPEEAAKAAAGATRIGIGNAFGLAKDDIDATVKKREDERKKSLADIEQQRKDQLAATKQMREDELGAHQTRQDGAIAAAKQGVDAARKAFNDATRAARNAPKVKTENGPNPGGIGELAKMASSQTGTMSGFAVFGLGAGGKTLEQIKENTAATAKAAKEFAQQMVKVYFWED